MGEGCLSSVVWGIIFIIVFTILIKSGLLIYMSGSLSLFDQLLQEVFKSLLSIVKDGTVYNPGY